MEPDQNNPNLSTPKDSDPAQQSKPSEDKKQPKLPTAHFFARMKKQRTIALLVGGIGLAGVTTFAILAFLGRVSGQFTIQLDDKQSGNVLYITDSENYLVDNGGTYLTAPGLTNARPVSADDVRTYCEALYPDTKIHGANNFVVKDAEENETGYAIVYTFYLKNTSASEGVNYSLTLAMDNYSKPTNTTAKEPIEYLRVMMYSNLINQLDPSLTTHDSTIFGMPNTSGSGTIDDPSDVSECIGSFRYTLNSYQDLVRDPSVASLAENRGYCTSFADRSGTVFKQQHLTIGPSVVNRFTFVIWLEGADPDCTGEPPENCSFSFTLNIAGE